MSTVFTFFFEFFKNFLPYPYQATKEPTFFSNLSTLLANTHQALSLEMCGPLPFHKVLDACITLQQQLYLVRPLDGTGLTNRSEALLPHQHRTFKPALCYLYGGREHPHAEGPQPFRLGKGARQASFYGPYKRGLFSGLYRPFRQICLLKCPIQGKVSRLCRLKSH